MRVIGFNGIDVNRFNRVMIPAGITTITANVTIFHGGVSFNLNAMEFTYDFQAGRAYTVIGRTQDLQWGVSVREGGEFLAFVPFNRQPVFTRR